MNWRCQDHTLVGVDGRRARITALRCRRWSCPFCAKRLHARMVRRAMAGFISGQRVADDDPHCPSQRHGRAFL